MKILVNAPSGIQEVIEIEDGGGYFDPALVLWDERGDGPLPAITLGAMVRNGSALEFDQARMDADTGLKVARQAAEVRAERTEKLRASDWTQIADSPASKPDWIQYRQALRDITGQAGFPDAVVWPDAP